MRTGKTSGHGDGIGDHNDYLLFSSDGYVNTKSPIKRSLPAKAAYKVDRKDAKVSK